MLLPDYEPDYLLKHIELNIDKNAVRKIPYKIY